MSALLSVRGVSVRFSTPHGVLTALDDVSLDIAPGETVALVGESGSGKSTLGKAVVGIVRPSAGSILIEGREMARASRRDRRAHSAVVQMIFQDPDASLNPRLTVGRIVEEPLIVHGLGDAEARRARVSELLSRVGLRADIGDHFPHEFSGGQRQRIGIARALALNPKLLIADEPVSALDVSVRGQVINLLNDLQAELGISYLFISHDLSVVQQIADRVVVLYLGRIVEHADRDTLWSAPLHPYTRALFDAVPIADPELAARRQRRVLEGEIPSALEPPSGCAFRTRCIHAVARCSAQRPPLSRIGATRDVACHLVEQDASGHAVSPALRPVATS